MYHLDGGWRRQSLVYFGKRYLRRRRAVDQWSFSTGILSRTIVPAINSTPCNPGLNTSRLRCSIFPFCHASFTLDTISAYSARRVRKQASQITHSTAASAPRAPRVRASARPIFASPLQLSPARRGAAAFEASVGARDPAEGRGDIGRLAVSARQVVLWSNRAAYAFAAPLFS